MKQTLLKAQGLKTLLLSALFIIGGGSFSQVWGEEESVTFSEQNYSNQQAIESYRGSNFTISFDKGTNSNAPKYYTSGTAIRAYGGNTFTVSSSNTITKVVITFGSGGDSNEITANPGTYESGTWTGSATEITFTVGGTSGNRRLAGFNVTYETSGGTPTCSTPIFDPAAGAVAAGREVSITTATAGATIYYTTDGNDPTTSSTKYTAEIPVTAATTIKAIAVKDGMDNSAVATAAYTITVAAPTISVEGTSATITAATAGNTIYYTTDGSTPTNNSAVYSSTIALSGTTTVKAIAFDNYGNASDVAVYYYLVPNAANVNSNYFTLVTDVNDLADGDAVIIVSGDKAMSTTQNNNNRAAVGVTVADNTINEPSGVQKLVLVSADNGWFFYTGSGYLYAASSSYNYLRTEDNPDANAKAAISINKTVHSITFQGTNTRNQLMTTTTSDNTIFACYSTAQTAVQIYKEVTKPAGAKVSAEFAFSKTAYYLALGEDFTKPTLTTAADYDGTIAYRSSNTEVATVNASTGEVTILGVGTTTITASANETATFYAGEASYTINVYQIEDGVFDFEAKAFDYGSGVELTSGNTYVVENKTWTAGNVTLVTSGKYRWWENDGTLRFYSSVDPASSMTISVPTGYCITRIDITGGSSFTANCGTYTSGTWNGSAQTVVLTYAANSGSVNVKNVTVTYAVVQSATLNAYGYATYASASPLYFNGEEEYSAWQITEITGDAITFSQVTTSVAAETGLLLKGTASAAVELLSTASGTTLSTNKLQGITEATVIEDNEYYGLSGQSFVPVTAGTVPAGKALLPASEVPAQVGVNAFTFVFEGADGVRTVQQASAAEAEAIFDISGRRLQQMQRGLNIVGGKKVIRKN